MSKPTVRNASQFKMVLVSDLCIDPEAQRKLSMAWVKAHIDGFDVDQLGYIVVNIREDGAMFTIDGQHRVELMRAVGWGDQRIHAEVFTGLTQAEEAELFNARNDRRAVRAFDRFRIAVVAGDPVECAITRIVQRCGLAVSDQASDGHVAAVAALIKIYNGAGMRSQADGASALDRTLTALTRCFGNNSSAFNAKILEGMGMVQLRYNGTIDQDALVKKLASFKGGAAGLLGIARALADMNGRPVHHSVAATIVDHYNKGRRVGQLDAWDSATKRAA